MISKVFSGHSFYGACRYICKDQNRSVIIATEGVRGHDYKLMAQDFITQHELRPSKKQACFHGILSFYPGENPGDSKLAEIARKYLQKIGITDTQFVVAKHTDKAHLHLHIIVNMVNNEGKSISDSWIALRGKKAAQSLTLEYKLTPAIKKDLASTHIQAFTLSEANKYRVYTAISENLPHCRTLKDLEKRLLKQGIEMQYKYKGQTLEKQGVSFKIEKDFFKGSKVDRQFSLGNLEKALVLQRKLVLEQNQEQPESVYKKNATNQHIESLSLSQSRGNDLVEDLAKGLSKTLEILMKPDESYEQFLPRKLSEEEIRRRKRLARNRGPRH